VKGPLALSAVCAAAFAAAGCTADPCASFSGQTCIALEVDGPSSLRVDQLGITVEGVLMDQRSPAAPRASAVHLPIALAILPGNNEPSTGYVLDVQAFHLFQIVGVSQSKNFNVLPGGHVNVIMNLTPVNGGTPDLLGTDLAGVDLAGVDLAGVDLAATPDLSGVPGGFFAANSGLDGANVAAVLPGLTGGTVFVGTSGNGVFRSTDGGNHWSQASQGIDLPYVTAMASSPITGAFFVAAAFFSQPPVSKVYTSVDGGNSWSVLTQPSAAVTSFAFEGSSTMYLGLDSGGGVLKSTDGTHFNPANTGLNNQAVAALLTDPLESGSVWLAGPSATLFKSTDSAGTWNVSNSGLTGNIKCLAKDPTTVNRVLAGSTNGLFVSTNDGGSWAPFTPSPNLANIDAVVFTGGNPATLFLATGGGGMARLAPGDSSWSTVNNGLANNELTAVAVDVSNSSLLYAGDIFFGMAFTLNSGASWTPSNSGITNLNVRALAIDPKTPANVYAAGQNDGFYKSSDGGATWTRSANGIPLKHGAAALAIDPSRPQNLYFAGENSVSQADGLYKSTDSGDSWAVTDASAAVSVLVDPRDTMVVWAGNTNTKLRKTTDGGNSWHDSNSGLGDTAFTLAVDASSSQIVYAGTLSQGVFKSTDAGATWSAATSGTETQINCLSADAKQSGVVYASGFNGIYKTTNGGSSWTKLSGGISGNAFFTIRVSPSDSNVVYTASSTGFFRSGDGGQTWTQANTGLLVTQTFFDIQVDPTASGTAYLAISGGPGVMKTVKGGLP
jgi:photosystem II stability/assembly factor-like uncharacterized protein